MEMPNTSSNIKESRDLFGNTNNNTIQGNSLFNNYKTGNCFLGNNNIQGADIFENLCKYRRYIW